MLPRQQQRSMGASNIPRMATTDRASNIPRMATTEEPEDEELFGVRFDQIMCPALNLVERTSRYMHFVRARHQFAGVVELSSLSPSAPLFERGSRLQCRRCFRSPSTSGHAGWFYVTPLALSGPHAALAAARCSLSGKMCVNTRCICTPRL